MANKFFARVVLTDGVYVVWVDNTDIANILKNRQAVILRGDQRAFLLEGEIIWRDLVEVSVKQIVESCEAG